MSGANHAPSFHERTRQEARIIQHFAAEEALASGLPGQDGGPADAYRHMAGVAEMSRRFGPLFATIAAEKNEWDSFQAMLRWLWNRREVHSSNMPAARAMDRHNNYPAAGIGAFATSTEDVMRRVRAAMDGAIRMEGGTGLGGTPAWRERRHWSDDADRRPLSYHSWPTLEGSPHFTAYRAGIAASGEDERGSTADGEVPVRAHDRDGHPVRAYSRSAPGP